MIDYEDPTLLPLMTHLELRRTTAQQMKASEVVTYIYEPSGNDDTMRSAVKLTIVSHMDVGMATEAVLEGLGGHLPTHYRYVAWDGNTYLYPLNGWIVDPTSIVDPNILNESGGES